MRYPLLPALLLLAITSPVSAQLVVPDVHLPPPPVTDQFPQMDAPLIEGLDGIVNPDLFDRLGTGELQSLLSRLREQRLSDFVRNNSDAIERDRDGNPAVRGQLLASGLSTEELAQAEAKGFVVLERETIEGLDIAIIRFAAPQGKSLKSAQKTLSKIAPDAEISADNIYFASGAAMPLTAAATPLAGGTAKGATLGLIDGGVAKHPMIGASVEQRGFAKGAPAANAHATAIASLLAKSAAGHDLLIADVYGSDPAGGNASAIARGLGWMVQRQVPVVTISLTGPDNALLRKAVAAASAKGVIIVAAIGNDGPAAPLNYPASYAGVVAVTAVDKRNRALPEAGRASHVDFAAPGAGMLGAGMDGKTRKLRGTSFAAPLVAARLVQHYRAVSVSGKTAALRALAGEAADLGKKGRDNVYGWGLVCASCATR